MDLIELGENTDSEYDEEHTCEKNLFPKSDRLVHCALNHDEKHDAWQMHSMHYADEQEVTMGEAEFVNEITYHSMILVSFCPFCGLKLNKTKK